MSTILGINAFHGDSSACLLVDGKLIAAAEEERFQRVKHWAGFPKNAIKYCIKEGKLPLPDTIYYLWDKKKLNIAMLNKEKSPRKEKKKKKKPK